MYVHTRCHIFLAQSEYFSVQLIGYITYTYRDQASGIFPAKISYGYGLEPSVLVNILTHLLVISFWCILLCTLSGLSMYLPFMK